MSQSRKQHFGLGHLVFCHEVYKVHTNRKCPKRKQYHEQVLPLTIVTYSATQQTKKNKKNEGQID